LVAGEMRGYVVDAGEVYDVDWVLEIVSVGLFVEFGSYPISEGIVFRRRKGFSDIPNLACR
jgi:hypothetical protein